MEKYLGIVKIYKDYFVGTDIRIISRTSNDKEYLEKWFNYYPDSEHVLLENTKELDSMFAIFKDYEPITEKDHKQRELIKKKLRKIMDEEE